MIHRYILMLMILTTPAHAERLSGINLVVSPFFGSGVLSNQDQVKSHLGVKGSLDKLFSLSNHFYIGPRVEAGNSYLTSQGRHKQNRLLSTYDNRFITGGFRSGFWFGEQTHPNDIFIAAGTGRGYSKLKIDESSENYYAQRSIDKIEGRYQTFELGGNWHVRPGFSFNASVLSHLYEADQNAARESVDSEIATTQGILLTSGEKSTQIDARVTQKTYGLALGFTLGF